MDFLGFLQFCSEKAIHFTLVDDNLKLSAPPTTLTPNVVAQVRQWKPELVNWIKSSRSAAGAAAGTVPIGIVARGQLLPVSYGQEQLWLAGKLGAVGDGYHFVTVLALSGALDVPALQASFSAIVARHESLRTVFREQDGELFQQIVDAAPVPMGYSDLRGQDGAGQALQAEHLQQQLAAAPFDLATDLMLRLHLIRLDESEHRLVMVLHHIASDGWSLGVLAGELQTLYTGFVAGGPGADLAPLPVQYADYAHWLRATVQGKSLASSLDYWTRRLDGVPEVHQLPTDGQRPQQQRFQGLHYYSQFDLATLQGLQRIAQQTGSTLFMVLECLYAVLISRHGHSGDVVLGTPVANRPHEDIGGLIGYFVNMLVLRHQVDQNISFLDLLAQVKQDVIEAFAYEQVPFDKVVRAAVKQRSASFSPLVQLIITLQNNAIAPFSLPGLACVLKQPEKSHCLFDLQLEATETPAGMTLHWEYDSDLFREASIARFADHFARLAAQVINDPDCALGKHDLLSGQERRQQLFEWNDTARDFPRESCIQELFEQRAQATPDAVAVRVEGQQLSYAALNAQANQLAHYLVTQRQVKPDTLVGICVERSLEMVIGILGILKAGGAYVPLDPDYPPARLAYMLDDAKLTTVLTQTHVRETTTISAAQALCMDDAQVRTQLSTQPVTNIAAASLGLTASHLAYAIYTSGSTGNPKASLLNHSGLCNLALGQGAAFAVTPESRVLQFASIAFDAATSEWCMALAHGASIVVLSNATAKSPDALSALVEQHCVTHATLPPVLLPLLKIAQWKSVHTLVVAGDACSDLMARLWSADRHFINAYGPSETTVCATVGSYHADQRRLHIGKPLQNVKVYVLTQGQDLVPQGVAGELHIGGVGLSRGYLNRPELTAEKFIANPFHDAADPASSERLYKTGDLVRWLADGNLEFLGRIDHQVKIRGFRIELGEIENALTSHALVSDAVVLSKDLLAGDKQLVAYVVTHDVAVDAQDESEAARTARQALIELLRRHLADSLPDYMMPAAFVLLARLPLSPNGKIDRKALPAPDASHRQAQYVAPSTPTEQALCRIWQDVLGSGPIGVSDDFFQLGGHSLLLMRVLSSVRTQFGVDVPAPVLFAHSTIAALGAYIDGVMLNNRTLHQLSADLIEEGTF